MFDVNESSHCKRKIEFCEINAFYFFSQYKKKCPCSKEWSSEHLVLLSAIEHRIDGWQHSCLDLKDNITSLLYNSFGKAVALIYDVIWGCRGCHSSAIILSMEIQSLGL